MRNNKNAAEERKVRVPLQCNTVNSCFFSKQFARFVGAGLALPLFHTTEKLQGQGKPSPYETRWVAQTLLSMSATLGNSIQTS
jgi:hypothetical protein